MRSIGADQFDDFEIMVIVHEATFASTTKRTTRIRLSAGLQQVQTNVSTKGIYQEALQLTVEQGTQDLLIELLDGRSVIANMKIPILERIIQGKPIIEQEQTLRPKIKGLANPKLKLTIHKDTDLDAEKSLLSDMNLSKGSEMLLQQHLLLVPKSDEANEKPLSAIQTLAVGLKGNLEMFGFLGSREVVHVAIRGPPAQRRYALCIFKDEKDATKSAKPALEVDFLKILSVQDDPGRPDVFQIHYMDARKCQQHLAFRRLDLPTGTWVELISKLIKLIREERDTGKKIQKPRKV